MAKIRDIVFDCEHAASLARFWAAALDGYEVAPYDPAELERLRARGIDDPEDDPTVLVDSSDGPVRLWFQSVPELKVAKNRVHLDLACADPDAELARLESLGAARLPDQPNDTLVVLLDPEGNEFCVLF
jgi:hypothetical protein